MLNRRGFLLAMSAGLLAAPIAPEAQPAGKAYTIGVLASQSASTQEPRVEAFRQRLRELGYEEGRNLTIHCRWAEGDYQRLPELASELVRLNMALIVASGGVPPALAKAATRTIPVVFLAGDPVGAGLVPSIARPGGNLTGFDVIGGDLNAKRLELLRDALPGLTRVAVLWNPGGAGRRLPATVRGARRPRSEGTRSVSRSTNAGRDRHRLRRGRTRTP